MRPISYESSSKCYKDAVKKAAARKEVSTELEVTGRFILPRYANSATLARYCYRRWSVRRSACL